MSGFACRPFCQITAKLRIWTLRIWGFRGPGFRFARHVLCGDASRLFLDNFPKHLSTVLGWTELCHEVRNPGPQKPQIIRNENHHLALFDFKLWKNPAFPNWKKPAFPKFCILLPSLGCRKWGFKRWGLKQIRGYLRKKAFFLRFLDFPGALRALRKRTKKSEKGRKRPISADFQEGRPDAP